LKFQRWDTSDNLYSFHLWLLKIIYAKDVIIIIPQFRKIKVCF